MAMAEISPTTLAVPRLPADLKTKAPPLNAGLTSFMAGFVAGGLTKTLSAPLCRLTILSQIQGAKLPDDFVLKHNGTRVWLSSNPFVALSRVWETEGFVSLWKGNLISVLHKAPVTAINYFVYERTKLAMRPYWPSQDNPGALTRFTGGFCGGCVAYGLCTPIDVLRTRLAGTRTGWASVSKAVQQGGLYRSMPLTSFCQGLNVGINFLVYETLNVKLLKEGDTRTSLATSLGCGALAGTIASCTIFPLDLMRRRQQVEQLSVMEVVKGLAKECKANRSVRCLYAGLPAELTKVVPAVGLNFYLYELCRQFLLGQEIAPR